MLARLSVHLSAGARDPVGRALCPPGVLDGHISWPAERSGSFATTAKYTHTTGPSAPQARHQIITNHAIASPAEHTKRIRHHRHPSRRVLWTSFVPRYQVGARLLWSSQVGAGGSWTLDAGCWILDTGYWVLGTGCQGMRGYRAAARDPIAHMHTQCVGRPGAAAHYNWMQLSRNQWPNGGHHNLTVVVYLSRSLKLISLTLSWP